MQNSNNSCDYLDQKISDLRNVATFLDELRYQTVDRTQEHRIGVSHAVLVEQLRYFTRQKNLITEEVIKLKFQNERIYKNLLGI
tara:strand:- start:269 stop:520 length:252 start_codon:yes stop_codon:yes gene_type:complete